MNASETSRTDTVHTARRLALVTGASSGIGQAYARRLAGQGWDLIVVGRRQDRLDALRSEFTGVDIRPMAADLGTEAGIEAVARTCAAEPITLLVNNAGLSHYMAFETLPPAKLHELLAVKVLATTTLARAVVDGMLARGGGSIVNVAGMLAYGATAPLGPAQGRATYVATLAYLVALSQALGVELGARGIRTQVLCPGIVATEFHERQGMDLSALPRMSAEDVVTASLRALELGESVCAPGVEDPALLGAVSTAQLQAFGGQGASLASRYRSGNDAPGSR